MRQARDESAFRELYRRHTPVLFALALRLSGEVAVASDAVHDTWIRGVDSLDTFEWRSSLRTWLTSILLNRLREIARHDARLVDLDEDLQTTETESLPHDIDAMDLEWALAMLPAGYKQVLVLHDIEGFKHREIADLLGIDVGTSKSQLTRARRVVRETLERGQST